MSASGVSKLDNGPQIRKSAKDNGATTSELKISPQESLISTHEISEAAQKAVAAELTSLALRTAELFLAPLIFTALGFFVRMYKIGANNGVVWDEAHFGKFGSYYLRHEFYHDVHPPLGKMLVGLSGYLAGYNGSWDFISGEVYPDYIDYTKMRIFQAIFSALCVPIAYYTGKEIGFGIPATWLFTLMVCLELLYVTLGRFILLDSMLLFFTVASFFAMARFNTINLDQQKHFGRKWWKWLLLTGVALGCTCSVKMVGLFVTTLVGIHTVVDLWNMLADKRVSWTRYSMHWAARFVSLVMIPILIFLISFKIHFDLLYKSGTGDAAMPSLFQANLEGSSVQRSPRDVAMFHSRITLKNQGLAGGLLHSHVQTFPEGSKQQQVTTYSHKDTNNEWIFERARGEPYYQLAKENNTDLEYITDGMLLRIMHPNTGRNLHTHEVPAPVTNSQLEVACYGNLTIGDHKDNWKVEIMDQHSSENKSMLHPLTTFFRLYNPSLDCYLGTSGAILPEWGFRQGEVVCHKNPFKKDKRMWWGIEENTNPLLPEPEDGFKLPQTNFLRNFVHLNLAMMSMNNALVIDHDKQDNLASVWWEWPTLWSGIRMCGWNPERVKYFMIGSPATTWTSSVGIIIFAFIVLFYLIRWQRQYVDFPRDNSTKLKSFLMGGIYPMIGWGLHYMPFVIMSRVTYVHHYVPALYFAMIVFCYEVQSLTVQWNKPTACKVKKAAFWIVYLSLYALVGGVFWYLRHISFGMEGEAEQYKHLNLLPSWTVV